MQINRRHLIQTASALAAASAFPGAAWAGNLVRLTSVKGGSVSWLIDTILAEKLDQKHGFELKVIEVATNSAGPVALLAGEADVIVSDWTWAMRQRSKGLDLKFSSYSSALGALMVVFFQELAHELPMLWTFDPVTHEYAMTADDAIMLALSLIDLSLAANLVVIVMFSGYENFVSKIDTGENEDRPEWMGTVDFSALKLNLVATKAAISTLA